MTAMDNRLKIRISRMLRSSFASCRTQNLSDVTDSSRFLLQHHDDDVVDHKVQTFPSICRPKHSSERRVVSVVVNNDSSDLPRKKVSDWPSPFRCPPASPITPLKEFGYCEKNINSQNKKKKKPKKKKKKNNKRKPSDIFPFRSCGQDDDFGGYWWYSSDDDDDDDYETDTLLSSKSLSSDSSRCRRRRHRRRKQRGGSSDMAAGIMPLQQGTKVKDTFAVVKRSKDPYNDFRTSMVEMIVEKRIFAPRDLENLLQCFLSLNSCNHHKIIVEVFTEIWEALFSDWF